MRAPPGPPRAVDDEVDGTLLGRGRTGVQEAGVPRAVRPGVVDEAGVLGVHQHQRPEPRSLRHGVGELVGREVRELLDTGVEQEALEAEDPGLVQCGQVGQVAGDRTAPEAHVDPRLVAGRCALLLERGHGGGRRDAVERHVDDGGDPARGRGAGRGLEALPLGAARLVDVHVGVHQPGEQDLVVEELDDGLRVARVVVRRDAGDPAGPDPDRDRCLAAVHHRAPGPDQDVELRSHGRSSSRSG